MYGNIEAALCHYTEPGYIATSAMLVQSALCMVYEKDALPVG